MSKHPAAAGTPSGKDHATPGQDLRWLRKGLNPDRMARLAKAEIEEARTATSRPRHWRPVDVDESQMR
jgi:ribosomal protein L16/L10AE